MHRSFTKADQTRKHFNDFLLLFNSFLYKQVNTDKSDCKLYSNKGYQSSSELNIFDLENVFDVCTVVKT